MKISLNWLTDYVDVSALPAGELADVLTRIGLCCESIDETDADIVLDLEVTSNRSDCLGHIGVAREVAAALGLELKLPDLSAVPVCKTPVEELTGVEVLAPDLCPRYTARVVRGVKVGPSPAWMVERLEAVGLRGINNVVDVTNYVLMEFGQPLHAFDRKRLAEGRIIVRRGRPGEQIVSIDETRCTLTDEMLIIADAEKPVAIAGIMGGLDSEVGDDTTDILIESAQFDPLTVRKAARSLSLMSESSYRFERGVDPVAVEAASLRACQLLLQTAGGELAAGVIDVWAEPYEPPEVTLRTDRCRKLLGVDIDDNTQAEILDRLGLSAELSGLRRAQSSRGKIVCRIPSWRGDLPREVDLIEEVARLHGYDKIPIHHEVTHPVAGVGGSECFRWGVRGILSAAGFDEAITYTFTDDEAAALFGFESGLHVDAAVRRTNNMLRPTLLGSLLLACKTNQDVGNEDVNLYELAAVFPPSESGDLPEEYTALGMITQRDLPHLRGALEAVIKRLAPTAEIEIIPEPVAGLAEGVSAAVHLGGKAVGLTGMVAPKVLDYYGLERPCAVAMLNFEALMGFAASGRTYTPLPRFPAVGRDLSLVVDESVTWAQLSGAIDSTDQPARESIQYVGTYRGKQVPDGKKSVTVSLTYRSTDGTLRSEQVDDMVAQVVASLGKQLGAELRS